MLAFCVLAAAYLLQIWLTCGQLPARVATHFNARGMPDGWMTREGFLWFDALLGLGVPLFILAVFASLRVMPANLINIPHREHWLAPERKTETMATITGAGQWIATCMIIFMMLMHHFVVQANAVQPARMDSTTLILAVSVLGLAEIGIVVSLIRRFARPPVTA